MGELPEFADLGRTRRLWDQRSDEYQAAHGAQLAAAGGAAWGVWQLPESELQVLGDVRGLDVLELGCGAAQWSIALRAMGADVVGLAVSERQLEHARRLMADTGVGFPLVNAQAEATPFDDASFDIVFCDHGAMTFADPYRTVPEVARILRPSGLFAFSMHTPILDLAWAPGTAPPSSRSTTGTSTPSRSPTSRWYFSCATANGSDWARRWPMEHIWRVRRTSAT